MQLDAVLFDVDDTLCRYRRSGSELLAAAFERTGLDPFITREEYHARYPDFVEESDSMADLRERCFAAIAAEKDRDPSEGVRVSAAYAAERDHGNVEPTPGLEAALSALSARPGLQLGVVTNGAPEMQSRKLEALGLAGTFETVVHAGYDAPAKPAPEPFEAALSALDARPERTLHVGNSLQSDVAGAHAAGVRSVWVPEADADIVAKPGIGTGTEVEAEAETEVQEPPPDFAVSTLAELPALLDRE